MTDIVYDYIYFGRYEDPIVVRNARARYEDPIWVRNARRISRNFVHLPSQYILDCSLKKKKKKKKKKKNKMLAQQWQL
jgi:hypothetical protein